MSRKRRVWFAPPQAVRAYTLGIYVVSAVSIAGCAFHGSLVAGVLSLVIGQSWIFALFVKCGRAAPEDSLILRGGP